MIINPYILGSAQLLLDTVDSHSAWSLRLLRTAYSGNCIEVRRSSDNTTQNIGFVNGVLDTASMLTFCGAGNGFVRTLYNQTATSSLNLTQTTAANQPQIVSSGALITENGEVAMRFTGSEWMSVTSSASLFNFLHNGALGSIFSVNKYGNIADPNDWYNLIGNNNSNTTGTETGFSFYFYDIGAFQNTLAHSVVKNPNTNIIGNFPTSAVTPNTPVITTIFVDADNATAADRSEIYVNGGSALKNNAATNAPSTSNATADFYLGSSGYNLQWLKGTFQEMVIYNTNQSTNKSTILNNINTYYTTY